MNAATLPERLYAYLPVLLDGAAYTLLVSAVAIAAGFGLGALLLGLSLVRGGRGPLPALVAAYVSFFRGTPMLVQLLMMFYLPAAMGLDLPPLLAAMIAMAANSAAFQCEILRAGLSAVPAGQVEAALSFGISPRQVFRYVQLPQVARAVWPAVVSEAIDVIKNSAIVSVIAVADLARGGRQIVAANFRPLEVYLAVGGMYLLMTGAVFLAGTLIARRMGMGGRISARVINRRAIRT
ncbi:amino acid ABC transporter permease [Bordetella genomosp. 13]|uniref:amino acid ABC transporter permease n=1 Tax=Bordetella genomosp. 13 TaxID=463040 RepID=UPI00119EB08A|nr:amino acid ABC transporter permease [Bordetella genomosp. 13]